MIRALRWPVVLFLLGVQGCVLALANTSHRHYLIARSDDSGITEVKRVNLGDLPAGSYSFYTKWEVNSESVAPLPADIEMRDKSGDVVVSYVEAKEQGRTGHFKLARTMTLQAMITVRDPDAVDGAEGLLVIAGEKSGLRALAGILGALGILGSLPWAVYCLRKKVTRIHNNH